MPLTWCCMVTVAICRVVCGCGGSVGGATGRLLYVNGAVCASRLLMCPTVPLLPIFFFTFLPPFFSSSSDSSFCPLALSARSPRLSRASTPSHCFTHPATPPSLSLAFYASCFVKTVGLLRLFKKDTSFCYEKTEERLFCLSVRLCI